MLLSKDYLYRKVENRAKIATGIMLTDTRNMFKLFGFWRPQNDFFKWSRFFSYGYNSHEIVEKGIFPMNPVRLIDLKWNRNE